ncbi:FAD-dependent monooxygenase [Streptomyces sp. NPDC056192]|uniref:FAD-dependent monooxygenase n=1 Tax=Streptomyces sp. NPDC056192 TaxID=3345743 RepID=UPI0035DED3E6
MRQRNFASRTRSRAGMSAGRLEIQYFTAGLRDAYNVTWRLASVLQQGAPEGLLDTYERDRRPDRCAAHGADDGRGHGTGRPDDRRRRPGRRRHRGRLAGPRPCQRRPAAPRPRRDEHRPGRHRRLHGHRRRGPLQHTARCTAEARPA